MSLSNFLKKPLKFDLLNPYLNSDGIKLYNKILGKAYLVFKSEALPRGI